MGWHDTLLPAGHPLRLRGGAGARRRGDALHPGEGQRGIAGAGRRARRVPGVGRARATTPKRPTATPPARRSRRPARSRSSPTAPPASSRCSRSRYTRQHYLDPDDPSKLTAAARGQPALPARRRRTAASTATSCWTTCAVAGWNALRRPRRACPTGRGACSRPRTRSRPSGTSACRPPSSATPTTPSRRRSTSRFEATEADVADAYWLAYREGCKGITIYREGSRDFSVLSHTTANAKGPEQETQRSAATRSPASLSAMPGRAPVPRAPAGRAPSITHKFRVGDQEGYLTVGLYPDGRARRALRQDQQGRLDGLRPHGRGRQARIDRAPVRRAARGARAARCATPASSPTARPATPRSRGRPPSSTTSSTGSNAASSATRPPAPTRTPSESSGIGCPDCGTRPGLPGGLPRLPLLRL